MVQRHSVPEGHLFATLCVAWVSFSPSDSRIEYNFKRKSSRNCFSLGPSGSELLDFVSLFLSMKTLVVYKLKLASRTGRGTRAACP